MSAIGPTVGEQADAVLRTANQAEIDARAVIDAGAESRVLAQFIYDINGNSAVFGAPPESFDGPVLRWVLIEYKIADEINDTIDSACRSGRECVDGDEINDKIDTAKQDAGVGGGGQTLANEANDTIADTLKDSSVAEGSEAEFVGPAHRATHHEFPAPIRSTPRSAPNHLALAHLALAHVVNLESSRRWVMRCDRVDFGPGAVAYKHTHPGPGIRRLLFGKLTVTTAGKTTTHSAGDAWFESGPDVVYAEATPVEETAFVRVMLLPDRWAGRRTIRYVEPGITSGSQRAEILGEATL